MGTKSDAGYPSCGVVVDATTGKDPLYIPAREPQPITHTPSTEAS